METVACNLCGSTRHGFVYEMPDPHYFPEEFFKVVECVECGLGFVNPRPRFAEMQKYYPSPYYEIFSRDHKWHLRRYARQAGYLEEIERRPGPKTLLDIGCAHGGFPRFMMARGWNVEGIEVSSSTERIRDFKLYSQPFCDIPVHEPYYDAVTAWAVLEHVHDPMAYFRKAATVIKNGGLFVFLVQNFNSLASRFLFCEDVPRHLYFFAESTVRRYLDTVGFELIKTVYDDSIYSMVAVNWLPFLIQTKIKRRPFRFQDRHVTRIEYLNRNKLKPGLLSTLRYMMAVPEAVLEQALMPALTQIQMRRGTFGTCIHAARKI